MQVKSFCLLEDSFSTQISPRKASLLDDTSYGVEMRMISK